MSADLNAQAVAVEQITERNRPFLTDTDLKALEEAAQSLHRMQSLALRLKQEAILPEGSSEDLTEELICLLRLPRS